MIGVSTLHHFAKMNLSIKPIRIVAIIIGGLLFGMAGLIAGSWVFTELSGWKKRIEIAAHG